MRAWPAASERAGLSVTGHTLSGSVPEEAVAARDGKWV